MSLVHYRGEIGEFDYNDEVFEIQGEVLHLKEEYKGPIDLPKGLRSCRSMFQDRDLIGCSVKDFDTSNIRDMACMFSKCKLPAGFTLGEEFSTLCVTSMACMFSGCELPEGFTLGNEFDTSRVADMSYMFMRCALPEGFTLGAKFNTSNVERMSHMFEGCNLPEGFTLGDKFSATGVGRVTDMFHACQLNGEYLKGDTDIIIKQLTAASTPSFDSREEMFNALLNIPLASIKNCTTNEELIELVRRLM